MLGERIRDRPPRRTMIDVVVAGRGSIDFTLDVRSSHVNFPGPPRALEEKRAPTLAAEAPSGAGIRQIAMQGVHAGYRPDLDLRESRPRHERRTVRTPTIRTVTMGAELAG